MTSVRVVPRYIDYLWYPILVKRSGGGGYSIVEMRGCVANEWNDRIFKGLI